MMSRFLSPEKPSGQPAEVLDRLMTYEREREERMALYRAAWERRWREVVAANAQQQPRAMGRVVK